MSEGSGRSPSKPAEQRHRPARFPHVEIRERPGRESKTASILATETSRPRGTWYGGHFPARKGDVVWQTLWVRHCQREVALDVTMIEATSCCGERDDIQDCNERLSFHLEQPILRQPALVARQVSRARRYPGSASDAAITLLFGAVNRRGPVAADGGLLAPVVKASRRPDARRLPPTLASPRRRSPGPTAACSALKTSLLRAAQSTHQALGLVSGNVKGRLEGRGVVPRMRGSARLAGCRTGQRRREPVPPRPPLGDEQVVHADREMMAPATSLVTWLLMVAAVAGATVAERLACLPPTKAIRVQSTAGSLRIFACGNRAGRCRWSEGFLGDFPFPPPFHSGAVPYYHHLPSSSLKISMLRAI
ncbi:hypothetical protein PR048_006731 [Dryococelus australis]|uniref:Uncharacterized protein n=1 Tax=Dryococelus australis TaxID=614101 RepID=A0ABQ9IBV1_9NEOP|nr:hypothetical protein PR048_006731 [Dryococelus australis]